MPVAERAHAARGALDALWTALRYCYPLLLVLLLWELVARAGLVRPLFLPTVTTVLEQFWVLLFEGEIVAPLLVSLYRAFAGLALAVVFGVLAGLWMARSKWAHWALDPLVSLGFPALGNQSQANSAPRAARLGGYCHFVETSRPRVIFLSKVKANRWI